MTSSKFLFVTFIGIFVAYNFIIADSLPIFTSSAKSTNNDFFKSPPWFSDMSQNHIPCPRGTGLKRLAFGNPPKCYQSGSQGPCSSNEILLPDSSRRESIYGICKSVVKVLPATALRQAPAKLIEIPVTSGTYVKSATFGMKQSKCQENERYSNTLKKCIKKALLWGKGGSTIG